jgi:NAD(P)-dependent dehydrogenase (short-subunit alcohol dehydrogenase family)
MTGFAAQTFGGLDILVNNAGGGGLDMAGPKRPQPRFPDVGYQQWSRTLDLNLRGPMLATQCALEQMRQRGGGAIVNIASAMGTKSVGQLPDAAYVASKAGLIGLTRELGSQWGRYGIRVNALAPGFFTSEMTAELSTYEGGAYPGWLLEQIPLGRAGDAGELDQALLLLLGDGGTFITGQALVVDGGMVTR